MAKYTWISDDEARDISNLAHFQAKEAARYFGKHLGTIFQTPNLTIKWFRDAKPGETGEKTFEALPQWGHFDANQPAQIAVKAGLGPQTTVEVVAHELRHLKQFQELGERLFTDDTIYHVLSEIDATLFESKVGRWE